MEIKDIRLTWDKLLQLTPAQQQSSLEELFSEYASMNSGYIWKSNSHVTEATTNNIPVPYLDLDTSINFNSTALSHKLIESDSYDALLFMQHTHKSQIGFIYSTLPANLGDDFNFNGKSVSKSDPYSKGKWYSYHEKRIRLCRNLLRPYGMIALCVNDSLLAQTKLMLDEIFGVSNYVTTITVRSATRTGMIVDMVDYVLVYSNNLEKSLGKIGIADTDFLAEGEETAGYSSQKAFQVPVSVYWDKTSDINQPIQNIPNSKNMYSNGDKIGYNRKMDHIGPFQFTQLIKTGKDSDRSYSEAMYFPIYYRPIRSWGKDKMDYTPQLSITPKQGYVPIYPVQANGTDGRWRWGIDRVTSTIENKPYVFSVGIDKRNQYRLYYKRYERFFYVDPVRKLGYSYKRITNIWDRPEYYSSSGTKHIKELIGKDYEKHPFYKSPALLSDLIMSFTANNDIVMDFGSDNGDIAEATLNVMKQYGRRHSFIIISPRAEETGHIAYKRLKKLAEGYNTKDGIILHDFKLLSYKMSQVEVNEEDDLEDVIHDFVTHYPNIASFKYTITTNYFSNDCYDIYTNQRNVIVIIVKCGFRPDVYKSISSWIEQVNKQYDGAYKIFLYALSPNKSIKLDGIIPSFVKYESYPIPLIDDVRNQNKLCRNKTIMNNFFTDEIN